MNTHLFLTTRVFVGPEIADACCALCERTNGLAPLDTDHTYERAARSWGFERDDALCAGCREELEDMFGRWPADASDYTFDDR